MTKFTREWTTIAKIRHLPAAFTKVLEKFLKFIKKKQIAKNTVHLLILQIMAKKTTTHFTNFSKHFSFCHFCLKKKSKQKISQYTTGSVFYLKIF